MINERLYEIRNNHRGTPMQIIRYGDWNDIDIEFLDDFHYIKEHQTYSNFKNGSIKNPYDKNVYGIGYLGEGNHVIKIWLDKSQPYKAWHELIARCYAEKKKDAFPAYYNICTVCDKWLCYNTFADWYVENQYEVTNLSILWRSIMSSTEKIINDITSQYIKIFKKTLKDISKVKVNPFRMLEESDEKDKEKLRLVNDCIENIKSIISELEGN